ncbi:MAG: WYL domain-containing protein [Lachnospiraceae bacterium]|nr:WYL domain-containing protein [Lachnospiraceae bacterium]
MSWLISFREKAVLIEPAWLREEIHRILLKMQDNYKMEGKEG